MINVNLAVEQINKIIAENLYFEATKFSDSGNWVVYFDEIEERFPWIPEGFLEENFEEIRSKLEGHPGVSEVWGKEETGEDCFDISLYGHYCGLDLQ